jgi:ParB-like nuclease domain
MTSTAEIVMVPIRDIERNPFRLLEQFPFGERKLRILLASYADVGMWEGVIGRRVGNKVEIAFGHYRVEAARLFGLTEVPMILRDLTDLQMLQFMGRENLEIYNADLLTMLETWRAAKKFSENSGLSSKPIDNARILGWTDVRPDGAIQLNDTARTCLAVDAVVSGGYMALSDFKEMGMIAAREIAERTLTRIEQQETLGTKTQQPRAEIERGKKVIGKAGKATADDYRKGTVSHRDLRSRVDQRALNVMVAEKGKPSPMFPVFAKALSNSIGSMLRDDAAAVRLQEIVKALPMVSMVEDRQVVSRLQHDLEQLGERATDWREQLTGKGKVALLRGV